MIVEVKLFATLRAFLPPDSEGMRARIELSAGATARDVLVRLGIPEEAAAILLVDGRFEADRARPLAEGSVLSVFPALAGG